MVTGVLGIHPSRLKVAGAYQGSTIIHFFINEATASVATSTAASKGELEGVLASLRTKALTGGLGLPYSVLSVQSSLSYGSSSSVTGKPATGPARPNSISVSRIALYVIISLAICVPVTVAIVIKLVRRHRASKRQQDYHEKNAKVEHFQPVQTASPTSPGASYSQAARKSEVTEFDHTHMDTKMDSSTSSLFFDPTAIKKPKVNFSEDDEKKVSTDE